MPASPRRESDPVEPDVAAEVWILAPARESEVKVWGLRPVVRLERILARAGVPRVRILGAAEEAPSVDTEGLLLRGDHLFDERLVVALLGAGPGILSAEVETDQRANWAACRARPKDLGAAVACLRESEREGSALRPESLPARIPSDLAPDYNPSLRKRDPAFLLPAEPARVRQVEDRIFASSYKGLTDAVTKWVWPLPARALTRVLARRGVRPNTITALSYLFTFLALGAFALGWFATGLVFAWGMTFLDTVDGKLARCTLTSSRLGHVLDHGLDLVHPPFWWLAFGWGLSANWVGLEWATGVIIGGYLLGRALEGIFMLAFGMEIFLWRPFDGFFRQIISRRNPNLVMLSVGVALGDPWAGFLAVAAWTAISNLVHAVRLAQAIALKRSGETVEPWYDGATG